MDSPDGGHADLRCGRRHCAGGAAEPRGYAGGGSGLGSIDEHCGQLGGQSGDASLPIPGPRGVRKTVGFSRSLPKAWDR